MFGYNCLQGNCNIIKYSGSEYKIWEIIDGCFMWVPCFIMVLCYGFIWWYILSNDKELKRVGHNDIRKVISKRERQTAMTFFSVCLCYFVCVIPSTSIVYLIHGSSDDYPVLNFVTGCLFYLQFSVNIFIYAAKSEQYEKAYISGAPVGMWTWGHVHTIRFGSHQKPIPTRGQIMPTIY